MFARLLLLLLLPLVLAASAAAQPQSVIISAEDCRALVRHEPAPDVAYRPGVDARGRSVAPADLNPSAIQMPEDFAINITVDLFERLGIPPGGGADYNGEVQVGTVDVTAEGQVLFNGRPVSDDAERRLIDNCRTVLERSRR